MNPALMVSNLHFSYGTKKALNGLSFSVNEATLFGIVGPNGGGKSTTFSILSGLLRPDQGEFKLFGHNFNSNPNFVRSQIGIVFQHPALDRMLSVRENLIHQGHLYGWRGPKLKDRISQLLTAFSILDRANDKVETLSGGLKRRVEIAKSLIHRPKFLILDEPTTGLDPLVRKEVWDILRDLKNNEQTTVLLTTHLLDEAEACDEIALIDGGKVVCMGSPAVLRSELGGELLSIQTGCAEQLQKVFLEKFDLRFQILSKEMRLVKDAGSPINIQLIPKLIQFYRDEIESITMGKPTLEDLFIQKTGHRFKEMNV